MGRMSITVGSELDGTMGLAGGVGCWAGSCTGSTSRLSRGGSASHGPPRTIGSVATPQQTRARTGLRAAHERTTAHRAPDGTHHNAGHHDSCPTSYHEQKANTTGVQGMQVLLMLGLFVVVLLPVTHAAALNMPMPAENISGGTIADDCFTTGDDCRPNLLGEPWWGQYFIATRGQSGLHFAGHIETLEFSHNIVFLQEFNKTIDGTMSADQIMIACGVGYCKNIAVFNSKLYPGAKLLFQHNDTIISGCTLERGVYWITDSFFCNVQGIPHHPIEATQ